MGVRILGIGLGLFIVLFLWTLTLLIYVVLWRSKGAISYTKISCLILALSVTGILVLIPRNQESQAPSIEEKTKVYDPYFIGRIFLLVTMFTFGIVGIVLMIITRWSQPLYATAIKH